MAETARPFVRRRLGLAMIPAALAASAVAGAAHAAADITGVWMVKPEYYLGRTLLPRPEVTPYVLEMQAKRRAAEEKGYVRSAGNMLCLPSGGVSLYVVRSPFVIMQGFGRINVIFETEGSNQPRTIYLNQTAHSPDIYPSFNGHSIGRWEGEVLVVDTIGFNGRGSLLGGIPKSTETHVVERISRSADGKELSVEITMTDPKSLAKPWTTTLKFERRPDTEERFEVWCEPDLEAFKTLNLAELKDADPEVARMLDPTLSAADPALAIANETAAGR